VVTICDHIGKGKSDARHSAPLWRIPEDKLRAMMGHDYKGITDYYTIINLAELEKQFLVVWDNSVAIDSFWER